jgi:hypothetical protein
MFPSHRFPAFQPQSLVPLASGCGLTGLAKYAEYVPGIFLLRCRGELSLVCFDLFLREALG